MCAQFLLKSPLDKVLAKFNAVLVDDQSPAELPERILPYKSAAVIVVENGRRVIRLMQFSLIPSWSREKRLKFSTHNARLDTIDSKATWRNPFKKHHCVVPLSHFIEPIYEGKYAGNMVRFFRSDHELLGAAAIFEHRIASQGHSELFSFAIITDDPCDYVRSIGHDRQPVFLDSSAQSQWLSNEGSDAERLKAFLKSNRNDPKLEVEIDRPLKLKR